MEEEALPADFRSAHPDTTPQCEPHALNLSNQGFFESAASGPCARRQRLVAAGSSPPSPPLQRCTQYVFSMRMQHGLKLPCSRASRSQGRQDRGAGTGAHAMLSVRNSTSNPASEIPNQIPLEIRNALKDLRLHKFYPKVPRTFNFRFEVAS